LIFDGHHGKIAAAVGRAKGNGDMVNVIYRDKTWEVKPGSTVRHIIEHAGLNPESILAMRDGKLVNDATLTQDGDTIKLIAVVSGG
jgi:sulfur carrier protein ThiS